MLEIEAKKKFEVAQRYFENKNYKKSQEIWSKILDHYPENVSVLRNLSLAYFYDRDLEQAESFLKRIITINKKEPSALTMLILILEDQDKIEETVKYIEYGLKEKILGEEWNIKKKLILPAIFKNLKDIERSRDILNKNINDLLNSKKKSL